MLWVENQIPNFLQHCFFQMILSFALTYISILEQDGNMTRFFGYVHGIIIRKWPLGGGHFFLPFIEDYRAFQSCKIKSPYY